MIHDLVPAPQFGTSEAVIAITYGGLYAVESGRETWKPLPRHERYEDMSLYLTCTAAGGGDCPRWESRLAGNWGGWVLYPGAVLRFTAQAELVRLVGTSLDGTLAVTVDGVDRGEASMQSGDIDLGGPGWHDVVLEVLPEPDGGAELDRLTLRGAGVALTVPAGQGEGGCSGGAAWLLVSLGLWRRGRRASARAPQR